MSAIDVTGSDLVGALTLIACSVAGRSPAKESFSGEAAPTERYEDLGPRLRGDERKKSKEPLEARATNPEVAP
jgi:hypothetical protein